MKKYYLLLLVLLTKSFFFVSAQTPQLDRKKFFTDVKPVEMTLSTDMRKLISDKLKMTEQPGSVTLRLPDSSTFAGEITIRARGITRKETCNMPPTLLNFKTSSPSGLSPLHKLKLVSGCSVTSDDERLALKEYIAYKIYNLLTDMSFRVRLVHITYVDTKGKAKTYTQYGYLIEDVDAMAKRNNCKDLKKTAVAQERTNRQQMTLVSLFEYMIANTDWSVMNFHNVKLLQTKDSIASLPYAVPYDFDYCGLVNAYYAVTSEVIGTQAVTERIYRGFPRRMDELQATISIFNQQKENIKNLIMNFEPLPIKHRKDMMSYIEDFYKIINDKRSVQQAFINDARTN
ncbi:MAG: hypothetical protein ACHQEB_07340 [Chitinophagales bacterium]